MSGSQNEQGERRTLFLVLFLCTAALLIPDRNSLHSLHETNSSVRFYQLQSVLTEGSLSIESSLCRWSERSSSLDISIDEEGRPYPNKSPGVQLVALPIFAALSAFLPDDFVPMHWMLNILSIILSLLPMIAAAGLLTLLVKRLIPDSLAMLLPPTLLLCSPFVVYTGLFQDYALGTALLVFALCLVVKGERNRDDVLAGLLFGLGGAVNYMFFIYGAITGLLLVSAKDERGRAIKRLLTMAVGGLVPLALVLAYHTWIWGDPFSTPYAHLVFSTLREGREAAGFRLDALVAVFVGTKLGMFFFLPWSFFGLVGLVMAGLSTEKIAPVARAGLGVLLVSIAFCCYWVGVNPDGAAFNRHLAPSFPFLSIGLIYLLTWTRGKTGIRHLLMGITAGSLSVSAIYAWVTTWSFPYHPARFGSPVWELNFPLFVSGGHVAPLHLNPYTTHGTGDSTGNWAAVLLTLVLVSLTFWCVCRLRETNRVEVIRRALFSLLTFTVLMGGGMMTDPVSEEARLRGNRSALRQGMAVNEKFSTVRESYEVPDGWGWRLDGYSRNPMCRLWKGEE